MKVVSVLVLAIAMFFIAQPAQAAQGDTTLLQLIYGDRFPGTPSSINTTVFVPNKSWARVILKVRLDCPCSKGMGEWDYTNTYFIRVPKGTKDKEGNPEYDYTEIARFITPYWGNQPSSSNFTWQWDITDYAFLMKDSTQFSVRYDGYTSSAKFSVWVEAIEGTPPYSVYALDKLWQQSFLYGNSSDPIDNHLLNKKFLARPEAKYTKLKITNTGHGGYGPQVVAEFIDKTHTIALNGIDLFTQHLWRNDCGSMPYYPQDGTWALPRAGWCPGDVVPTWDWDITPYVKKSDSTRLDYKMESFVVDDKCNGIYSIAAQVMYANAPNFSNDVSLEEILAPNSDAAKTKYNRMNPICGNPIIRVRNNGKNTVTSIEFEYGVRGESKQKYTWTGSLDMMQTADITLPAPDWKASFSATTRNFECSVLKTNGKDDEYPLFNSLSSTYSVPPTFDSRIQVNLKTNRQVSGQGYYWEIRDANDSLIVDRQNSTLADETRYSDSLNLDPGCYVFRFVNPSGYGLDWWATSKELGSGSLNFTSHGQTIRSFNGDCGNGIYQQFIVGVLPQLKVLDDVNLIDFGPSTVGVPTQKTIKITALNSSPLQVSKVGVTTLAKGFTLVSTDPVIPSGSKVTLTNEQTMSITVQYTPIVTTRKAASLNIESNDYYQPTLNIPMSGGQNAVNVEEDESGTASLQVIPSTSGNTARILFRLDILQSPMAHCSLYNTLGQEVKTIFNNEVRTFSEQEVNSDVSDLQPGVYFVVLRCGKLLVNAPLIISR